jgi:hypothetical protein
MAGMTIPHFNVVICTPGSSMTPSYVRSLLKVTYYMNQNNITWNFMTEYSSHVADARERTLGGSAFNDKNQQKPGNGEWTYDKLFWIDSDIEWEPDDFFRLLQSDKQVISGCYMMESEEVTVYPVPLGPPLHKNDILKLKAPFTTRGVGFGFLAVASGVFESIPRPWFSSTHVIVQNTETGQDEYKFPLMGEDLSWCEKVYQMGIDIWVDPLVRVGHQKTVKLRWPS